MSLKKNEGLKNKTIKIGNRLISDNQPVFIIAEIGINHNGSLQIARQLIKLAADCGIDAVKFQKRDLGSLYQSKYLNQPRLGHRAIGYLLPLLTDFELTDDDYFQILKYCQEFNVQFLCTPFDRKSVDFLEKIKVPAYKVGSPDMTNFSLLEYICSKKKPLIVSTGMSNMEEIAKTVEFLDKFKANYVLLHCNSNYPAPFHNINLRVMNTLREKFNCLVGYSGHEYGISVSQAAVALGACIIERHFTLDRTMIGPDHAASLEPTGLKTLVRDIRQIEQALGTQTRVMDRGEFMNREALGKSLVAKKAIKKGSIITKDMIISKSPGTGLSPQRIDELINKKTTRDIGSDEPFLEMDCQVKTDLRKYKFKFKHNFGIMVRPVDYDNLLGLFKPDVAEFHLTDEDIESNFLIRKQYKQKLIIHAPEYCHHDLFNLASEESRIREKSIQNLKNIFNLIGRIKQSFKKEPKTTIIVHPGGMYQAGPSLSLDSTANQQLYRYLDNSLMVSQTKDCEILIENMPPFPWYFGGQWNHSIFLDADEIVNFCRNRKYFICLDVSHAALYCNYRKINMFSYLQKLIPFTKHMHIADASSGIDGEGLQIGEGSINFKKIAPIFKNYKGTFSVEIWQGHKEYGKGFIKALEKLEDLKIL